MGRTDCSLAAAAADYILIECSSLSLYAACLVMGGFCKCRSFIEYRELTTFRKKHTALCFASS